MSRFCVRSIKPQTELMKLLKAESEVDSELKQNNVRLENNQERQKASSGKT